jgi:tryptophan synthase alpha chain
MNRLRKRLEARLAEGKKLLVPFLTAGDRGLAFTAKAIQAMEAAGADAVEVGVPFSDPLADGSVIQGSSERALALGTTLEGIFSTIRGLKNKTDLPILLMGYLNPFLSPGLEHTARQAQRQGVDGFIIPDLPPDLAGEWTQTCRALGLDTVFLVTPNSTPDRIRQAIRGSSGYVYYVSVTGTTGARTTLPADLSAGIKRVRALSAIPVLVGFGISTPEQARVAARLSDGVIIGSALIKQMLPGISDAQALRNIHKFIQTIRKTLDRS